MVLVNSTDMHTWLLPVASLRLMWQHADSRGGIWSMVSLDLNWHPPVQPLSQQSLLLLSLLIPLSRSPRVYLLSSTYALPLPLLSLSPPLALSLCLFLAILPGFFKGMERFSHSAAGILAKVSPSSVFPDFPLGHLEFTASTQWKQRPTQDAGLQATQSFPTLRVARLSDPRVQDSLYRDPHWQ